MSRLTSAWNSNLGGRRLGFGCTDMATKPRRRPRSLKLEHGFLAVATLLLGGDNCAAQELRCPEELFGAEPRSGPAVQPTPSFGPSLTSGGATWAKPRAHVKVLVERAPRATHHLPQRPARRCPPAPSTGSRRRFSKCERPIESTPERNLRVPAKLGPRREGHTVGRGRCRFDAFVGDDLQRGVARRAPRTTSSWQR